jgi:hypothetical protein
MTDKEILKLLIEIAQDVRRLREEWERVSNVSHPSEGEEIDWDRSSDPINWRDITPNPYRDMKKKELEERHNRLRESIKTRGEFFKTLRDTED